MSLPKELADTRDELLKVLARAAGAGDTSLAVSLARNLEDLDRDYRLALEIERRAERIREDLTTSANGSTAPGHRLSAANEGRKAKGDRIRREFAQAHGLQQVKGVLYRTPGGRSVGIATASEDRRGNRWWLGLPDVKPDVVVLVCDQNKRHLNFVIPQHALAEVWDKLSRDALGKVKFNIKRAQGNHGDYELLVTSDVPMSIQPFLSQYAPLA